MSGRDELGDCCVALHGHLPYVHHPEHEDFLEEHWLFEAVIECYLPLLFILEDLAQDRVRTRITIGLTPPLLEMLRSPALLEKIERYLDRRVELATAEKTRVAADPLRSKTAKHYLGRFRQMREFFEGERGDLVGAFRRHLAAGRVEILASAATHAVLPLCATDLGRSFQIRLGVELYEEVFGRRPAGFWLPECAFAPGIDRLLADAGVRYVILESHGVLGASPHPKSGLWRPIRLPAGVAGFGRDQASGRQVWSSSVGYPGDPAYRELYRDLGFDGPYEYVKPWLQSDGIRRNLGIKYHRVTGKTELHEKDLYDVDVAKARAREHAQHFVTSRHDAVRAVAATIRERVCVTAPYDCELFGHWWYEGPWFLEQLFRNAAARPELSFRFSTPSEVLAASGPISLAHSPSTTWGRNGFLEVWLNETNAWVLRHQHELERRMIDRARRHVVPSPLHLRILNQMARELLLLQSSDWAFIITMQTSAHYAEMRARDHVDRFLRLEDMLDGAPPPDPDFLATIERGDAIFPGIDYRGILGESVTRPGATLGTLPARDAF